MTPIAASPVVAAALVALVVLGLGGCGLLSLAHPPNLPLATTTLRPPTENPGPLDVVDIAYDARGIPHVGARSDEDLAYGLGFVHARDRLFQIEILRHAATGRLTELFGEDFLGTDQQLRLLTYRLEEQEQRLSTRDLALAAAYVNGVNAGARHAGLSAEMRVLRTRFETFTVRDVLAIIRLQSWGLSVDLEGELLRERVLLRLPPDDPRRDELVRPVPADGVDIMAALVVDEEPEPAAPPVDEPPTRQEEDPAPGGDAGVLDDEVPLVAPPSARRPDENGPPPSVRAVLDALGLDVRGASNSWVVDGAHTEEGVPVLVNDPHLRHQAPSVFYLASLHGPTDRVVGATFPGMPGVVIGGNGKLAWGMTTSYVDTQDLVRITVDPARSDRYLLDGKPRPFGRWVQRFEEDGALIMTTVWRTTVFGPILPPTYDVLVEPGNLYALQWTGFDPDANTENISGFWDLGRATSVDEARAALEKVGAPSQNVVLATTTGDIAYHLMGKIPRRRAAAPVDRPRDGRASEAGWSGYLSSSEKPALLNPPRGYIVAANQRVSADGTTDRTLGVRAAPPYRALRIDERLRALLDEGRPDAAALLAIQQDIVSVEALRLAPILGRHCPEELPGHTAAAVRVFCDAVRRFDGRYDPQSTGALPFTWLYEALVVEILATHLGTDLALLLKDDAATLGAIEHAIRRDEAADAPVLLDDLRTPEREGLAGFVARAALVTLDRLVDELGDAPTDWRWGRVHVLTHRSSLGELPVVGGVFRTPETPEAGWRTTVRAEGGIPVRTGAVLRHLAVMSETPRLEMILDLGQSGHLGHPNATDMRGAWSAGTLLPMVAALDHVKATAKLRLEPWPPETRAQKTHGPRAPLASPEPPRDAPVDDGGGAP